jgi:hypothetical protein
VIETRRALTEAATDRLLQAAHLRRVALWLVDLAEVDAQVRLRALDKLTPEQFLALLHLPDDLRDAQLHAMELGQRHSHAIAELRVVARSEADDRPMYRWWCACGAEAAGDLFEGGACRAHWERHAGITPAAAPSGDHERRECAWEGCTRGARSARRWFSVRADRDHQRYCCGDCREADRAAPRRKPELFGMEDE